MTVYGLHSRIVETLFGASWSDQAVTFTLVRLGLAFTVFQMVTVLLPAPYGRHRDVAPAILKLFPINTSLAWIVQESPSFFIPLALTLEKWNSLNPTQVMLLSCFITHYFHRSFVFPLLIRPNKGGVPLITCSMAFVFCCFNGFLQAHAIIYSSGLEEEEYLSPRFVAGLSLFLLGMLINQDSDRRLQRLRSGRGERVDYLIPHGGFFELVSAANYFGEILEWTGFWLAGRNQAGFFFATFTAIFLGTRGLQHHRFYLEKFKETYPSDRKAVIPYFL